MEEKENVFTNEVNENVEVKTSEEVVVPEVNSVKEEKPLEKETAKEPEIKEASSVSKVIGTVIFLAITIFIVFWMLKRYFLI